MNHRHLWIRSKKQHAILRVRHEIIKAIRNFFDNNDFTLVDSPIFTPNAAEGTSTLFATEYFVFYEIFEDLSIYNFIPSSCLD